MKDEKRSGSWITRFDIHGSDSRIPIWMKRKAGRKGCSFFSSSFFLFSFHAREKAFLLRTKRGETVHCVYSFGRKMAGERGRGGGVGEVRKKIRRPRT